MPAPAKKPKLTSALLFKVPGGVTGETGRALLRAKEIERRLGVARTEASKKRREARASERATSDWSLAAQSISDLEAAGGELGKLTNEKLSALVRVLKLGNGQGNKAALVASLAARVAMPVAMSSLPSVRPSSAVPRHRISLSHCQPLGRLCLSPSLNLGRLPTPQQWFLRSHCHWHVVDRVGARRVALDQRRKSSPCARSEDRSRDRCLRTWVGEV